MTLPSLRNLRITRPNTRPASDAGAAAAGVRGLVNRGLVNRCLVCRWPWRSRGLSVVLAAGCLLGIGAARGDEPTDPISKLGQRSALQRWKDARADWTNSRRERRQQSKHGGAMENSFAPDAAAPETPATVAPAPATMPDLPGHVDLSPVTTETLQDIPAFLAPPPRMEPVHARPLAPVPEPIDIADPLPAVSADSDAFRDATPSPAWPTPPAEVVLDAPLDAAPTPLPDDGILLAPAEPTATTALLPQIPRTPVDQNPTPAPPPRLAPAPALTLPEESPRFTIPRSDLIGPSDREAPRIPRTAGPVELPQLKKITEIQPFRTCSTDGSGVTMCPPGSAGAGVDRCPEQLPLPILEGAERNFIDIEYCWDAPNLFRNPLYFEDVALERYGHTYCEPIQSIASASKFGLQLVGLPYQMALAPVHKRETSLGYYRPGDPAPHKCYQIPLNAEAAFKAAYVYTGMSFIVP